MSEGAGLGHGLHRPLEGLGRGVAGHPCVALGVGLRRHLLQLLGELAGLLLGLLGGRAGLGALGVDVHGVDHPVGAAAAGQLAQHLDRVLGVEVDRLGALAAGRVQARGLPVDGYVGQHGRLVVGDLVGQLDQADVGERDPDQLGLHAVEGATGLGAAEEGRAGLGAVGIGDVA